MGERKTLIVGASTGASLQHAAMELLIRSDVSRPLMFDLTNDWLMPDPFRDDIFHRRPTMIRRPKDKPSGPTKKRAKVKAARKANLKRTRA